MGQGLSMAARHEITKKYTRAYTSAAKKDRGRMLGRSRGSHWLVAGQHPAGDRHDQQAQGPGAGSHTQATGAHLRV